MHLAKTLSAVTALTFLTFFPLDALSQTFERPGSDGTNAVYKLVSRAVAVGMDRSDVLERLGQPAAQLTPNIWAYPRTSAGMRPAGTLIVSLINDRVKTLFVGNDAEVEALVKDLREQVLSARAVAAK